MKKTFALIGLGIALTAAPVMAQPNDVSQLSGRINQLENQIQTLSRAVFRGDVPPPEFNAAPAPANSAAMATLEVRLSQLEAQIQELTGQIEQQQYQMNQLKQQMESQAAVTAPPANAVAVDGEPMRPVQMTPNTPTTPYSDTEVIPTYSAPAPTVDAPVATNTPAANAAALSAIDGLSPDQLYEKSFVDIRDGNYDAAELGFKTFLDKYPDHSLASNAHYWLAETYYVRADYNQSAKLFAQGYQDYPESSKSADNLLKLGLSLGKLGNTEDACLSLQQIKTQFPDETGPVMRRADQELKNLNCE